MAAGGRLWRHRETSPAAGSGAGVRAEGRRRRGGCCGIGAVRCRKETHWVWTVRQWERGRSGPTPPSVPSSVWWVNFPWRAGTVLEFTGTWAARRNSGPGREKAADAGLSLLLWRVGQLLVIRTPCVALSVVSSVDTTLSTVKQNKGRTAAVFQRWQLPRGKCQDFQDRGSFRFFWGPIRRKGLPNEPIFLSLCRSSLGTNKRERLKLRKYWKDPMNRPKCMMFNTCVFTNLLHASGKVNITKVHLVYKMALSHVLDCVFYHLRRRSQKYLSPGAMLGFWRS